MHEGAKVSAGTRVGRWFDANGSRLGWGIGGVLIGLVGGWWVGSYLACSETSCEARPDSVEAAGTWFGAIGTVAAVLTAVAAFRAEERRRRASEQLALLSDTERENALSREANQVRIGCHVNHTQAGRILGFSVNVHNAADRTSVFRLKGRDFAGPLSTVHELGAGQSVRTDRNVGNWTAPPEVSLTDRDAFEAWCEGGVTVTFKMNGRYWRRRGHQDAELIEEWDAEGPEARG